MHTVGISILHMVTTFSATYPRVPRFTFVGEKGKLKTGCHALTDGPCCQWNVITDHSSHEAEQWRGWPSPSVPPETDAADNTEATCVTPCFIHKADFNASCRVLVWVCQHRGNWLIFFTASSCKLTLTYWSCEPHSVSLILLPLPARLSACLSLHHVYRSVYCPLASPPSSRPPSLSLRGSLSAVKRKHEKRWANMPAASDSFSDPTRSRLRPVSAILSTCNITPLLLPHRIRFKWEMYCFLHSLKSKSNWVNLSGLCLLRSSRD